jgi:acyl CoA:acetate/3-ketoacid CoA transferase alpha subunit
LALQAAAWRVPFLPSRVGLGSDLLRDNPGLTTFPSPVGSPEPLVAVPAFTLDATLCHLNRADRRGNALYLGPDLYWDDLMLLAAPTGGRFISCERLVDTADLAAEGCLHQLRISRMMVDGVVEAPGGAHFTLCEPDYPRDEEIQRAYALSARSPEAWASFRAEWIDIPEDEYQRKVRS